MICVSPINIQDPRQSRGSVRMTVPCGRCGACKYNRRVDWSFRLKEELKQATSACFVTLTYSDTNLCYGSTGPVLVKEDLQLFMKRLRKAQSGSRKSGIRYYAVGEYGTTTHRPHYHLILYNVRKDIREIMPDIWKLGHVHIGEVSEASIHYMTKYHVNYRRDDFEVPEFALMSRRPGIGAGYIQRAGEWNTDNGKTYIINNGYAQRMPRYYKEKLFSAEQRSVLAEEAQAFYESAYWKEYRRLEELGIEDPDRYMENSRYLDSLKVEHKFRQGGTL